jgi:ribosomal protein S18 acetylase RimI-like enzyme
MNYLTVPLKNNHKRSDFCCEKQLLDKYFHEQVTQDIKRKLSACFVIEGDNDLVKGYYTLSGASIKKDLVPENIKKKMPPAYQDLPVTLLGRLAIDKSCKGQGLGEMILLDALSRSYDNSMIVGSIAVIVDPLDDDAVNFYKKYGFIALPDSEKMFIAMKTIEGLLKD